MTDFEKSIKFLMDRLSDDYEGMMALKCIMKEIATEREILEESLIESETYKLKYTEANKELSELENEFLELDRRVSNISGEYKDDIQ